MRENRIKSIVIRFFSNLKLTLTTQITRKKTIGVKNTLSEDDFLRLKWVDQPFSFNGVEQNQDIREEQRIKTARNKTF